MSPRAESTTRVSFPVNRQDPSTYLKPDEPLIGADGRDWSWCYIWFEDVPDFPGYRAEWHGRVWTNKRGTWRQLTHFRAPSGHIFVNVRQDGRDLTRQVHSLVLAAFEGRCPEGMEGCHNNGDPANNRLDNLRWDTRASNIRDSFRHGVMPIGEQKHSAKLTPEKVRLMREQYREHGNASRSARDFGISNHVAWEIVTGKKWKHVV